MASIFGTEKDMVNCPFFYKIGACRNGIKCKRLHNKPTFSQVTPSLSPFSTSSFIALVLQTVLLKNLYHNPKLKGHDAGLSNSLHSLPASHGDSSVGGDLVALMCGLVGGA